MSSHNAQRSSRLYLNTKSSKTLGTIYLTTHSYNSKRHFFLTKKKSINWCYSPDLEASLHLNMKKLTLEKKSTEIEEDNESNIPP